MRQVHLCTDSDLDGSSVRVVFEHYLGERLTQVQCRKHEIDDTWLQEPWCDLCNEIIFFSDLVPSPTLYTALVNRGNTVFVIDHHPSSYEELFPVFTTPEFYMYDEHRCSALLAYTFWSSIYGRHQCLEEYVELVNIYDTWKDDHAGFRDAYGIHVVLQHYLKKYRYRGVEMGYTHYVDLVLKKITAMPHFKFLEHEEKIVSEDRTKRDADFKKLRKKLEIRTDLQGRRYGFIELSTRVSLFSSWFLKEEDIEYLLIYNAFVPAECKFSMRTRKDIDLSVLVTNISRDYVKESGGHKKAAGLRMVSEEIRDQIRKNQIQLW